ncbi:MAG: MBL fold metallo-hydrolase [Solirubrobacteraceae bacterium]
MFFRQVLYRDLGCASYIMGDAGEAIVVDPRWDIEPYLEIAEQEHLQIVHVLDTHEHADHVSGRIRLARATGAQAHAPASSAGDAGSATGAIAAGDELSVGALRVTALAAPGHRPEHLIFSVADLTRSPEPWILLTGDSLLVGDIARPDLAVEAVEGARALHSSLGRMLELSDHVEVWPAHIGGSLCGGAGLSGKTSSTIGFERRHNPLLGLAEPDFVHDLTATLPPRPPNIDRIVDLNRMADGTPPPEPPRLDAEGLREAVASGAIVIDGRAPVQFDAGHVVGALNLPAASPGMGTRAGWALDPLDRLVIVAADQAAAHRTASALQAVGFWTLAGVAVADLRAWERVGVPVAMSAAWDLSTLAAGLRRDEVDLIDVREPDEWTAGHIPGSQHMPLSRLRDSDSLALAGDGHTTAVSCAAGARAAFAASLLRRGGRERVVRVEGGGVPDLPRFGLSLTTRD